VDRLLQSRENLLRHVAVREDPDRKYSGNKGSLFLRPSKAAKRGHTRPWRDKFRRDEQAGALSAVIPQVRGDAAGALPETRSEEIRKLGGERRARNRAERIDLGSYGRDLSTS